MKNGIGFAKGYEHGFTGAKAESDDADYMRGYNLGTKQKSRVVSGTNTAFKARAK